MKGDANNYSILEEELGRKMHKANCHYPGLSWRDS